jgi:hypothetical protein
MDVANNMGESKYYVLTYIAWVQIQIGLEGKAAETLEPVFVSIRDSKSGLGEDSTAMNLARMEVEAGVISPLAEQLNILTADDENGVRTQPFMFCLGVAQALTDKLHPNEKRQWTYGKTKTPDKTWRLYPGR